MRVSSFFSGLLDSRLRGNDGKRKSWEYKFELFAAKVLKLIEVVAVPGTVIVDDQGKVMIRVARHSRGTLDYFDHEVPFYSDIYFEQLKNGHIALHKKVDKEFANKEDRIRCSICGGAEGQMIEDLYQIENGTVYKTDHIQKHAICENCYSGLMQAMDVAPVV